MFASEILVKGSKDTTKLLSKLMNILLVLRTKLTPLGVRILNMPDVGDPRREWRQ